MDVKKCERWCWRLEENVNVKSVPINEQETHISFMRDESFARIYTSDTT